jgi:hypothetical protein
MNCLKQLVTTFAFIFMLNAAFSQKAAIGLRIGAAYYSVNNELVNDLAEYDLGLDIAVPVEFSLSSLFSIQPELHYTQKGAAFEGMVDGLEQRIVFNTNYLELPVLLKANHGTERFSCYLFAAPAVGYALNRTVAERVGSIEKAKQDVDFINEGPARDRRWEFSVMAGVGFNLKAGPGHLTADVRYSLGLTDDTKFESTKPDDWNRTTSRGCTLSVGYMIPIGK